MNKIFIKQRFLISPSFGIKRSVFLVALLLSIFSKGLIAQQIQQPAFQITIPNNPGYSVDLYSVSVFRSQSTQSSYGFILVYSKFLRTDNDGRKIYDYQSHFLWLDSQGKLIAVWRAPEPFYIGKVVSLTNSRAVLLDYTGGGEMSLHYLIRSGKSIVHRVAEGLADSLSADGAPSWTFEQMVKHGFARITQNDNLDKTTIEYFSP